jgi:hypothetical protein
MPHSKPVADELLAELDAIAAIVDQAAQTLPLPAVPSPATYIGTGAVGTTSVILWAEIYDDRIREKMPCLVQHRWSPAYPAVWRDGDLVADSHPTPLRSALRATIHPRDLAVLDLCDPRPPPTFTGVVNRLSSARTLAGADLASLKEAATSRAREESELAALEATLAPAKYRMWKPDIQQLHHAARAVIAKLIQKVEAAGIAAPNTAQPLSADPDVTREVMRTIGATVGKEMGHGLYVSLSYQDTNDVLDAAVARLRDLIGTTRARVVECQQAGYWPEPWHPRPSSERDEPPIPHTLADKAAWPDIWITETNLVQAIREATRGEVGSKNMVKAWRTATRAGSDSDAPWPADNDVERISGNRVTYPIHQIRASLARYIRSHCPGSDGPDQVDSALSYSVWVRAGKDIPTVPAAFQRPSDSTPVGQ